MVYGQMLEAIIRLPRHANWFSFLQLMEMADQGQSRQKYVILGDAARLPLFIHCVKVKDLLYQDAPI